MELALDASFISWKKSLPSSRMAQPKEMMDYIKYAFWRLYTPYHPFLRDLCLKLRIVHHKGRQDFLIGRLDPSTSLKDTVSSLIEQGYGNHFIAWKDDGEVIGLRLVESFTHQYHIRIFADGEIRGHYEYTPEYRPILHFKGIAMEDRREVFLNLFGDKIITA